MRAPRTRFAASFVAVVASAGACSHEHAAGGGSGTAVASDAPKQPRARWSIMKGNDGTSCYATPVIDCSGAPAGVSCNPPASTRIACPPADVLGIVTYDGTHCTSADGKTVVTCPGVDTPPEPAPPPAPTPVADKPFVGRRWQISAGDGKTCWAEPSVDCDPAVVHHTCNPPAPTKVTCPPYNAGNHVDEIAPDKCQMLLVMGGGHCPPNMHCNPPPPREVDVPCPGDK